MRKVQNVCLAVFLAAVFVAKAHTAVITVDNDSRGWYTSSSSDDIFFDTSSDNYFAGFCSADGCGDAGEHRNFFSFTIPALDSPAVSAVLTLSTGTASFNQSPAATYQITSIPDFFGFDDLGTGTVFGSLDYSAADTQATQTIALNAAGIAAIASNATFSVGGRITNLLPDATEDESLFGATDDTADIAQLTITTAPEPLTSGICGVGLVALCLALRHKKAR